MIMLYVIQTLVIDNDYRLSIFAQRWNHAREIERAFFPHYFFQFSRHGFQS